MLTKRQYLISEKCFECVLALEKDWAKSLAEIRAIRAQRTGLPAIYEIHEYQGRAASELRSLRPWLLGEKFSFREIARITRPLCAMELILCPDVQGGKGLGRALGDISKKLPNSFFDYLPFSGLWMFLKRALT